jgi:hypothetical protein
MLRRFVLRLLLLRLLTSAIRRLASAVVRLRLLLEVRLLVVEVLLRLLLTRLAGIVAAILGIAVHILLGRRSLRLIVRILLAELLLRRRDQAQIMLGMLMVRFRSDVVADRGGIARELQVFLGDVVRGAADLNVRPVRLVDTRQWIVVMAAIVMVMAIVIIIVVVAVASAHALVLTVSHHGSPVRHSLYRR